MKQKSGTGKAPAEQSSRTSAARPASSIRPRRRSASCWRVCEARDRSQRCAGARGSPRACTYTWSKEFLEAGKKRLAGDTARSATSDEVKVLRRQARDLKEVVAEQALELRIPKKRHDRG